MVSAGTIFTNDRLPRATTPDLKQLRPSEPDEHTLPTLVREGAAIGAGSTIGNNLTIGRFAMIGMGSLVTKTVPAFHLVIGHPAISVGCVCRCGHMFFRLKDSRGSESSEETCRACGLRYTINCGVVTELARLFENLLREVEPF